MFKEIKSLQHQLVKHIVKLRQNRDYRYDQQSVVVEGIKPVTEISQKLSAKVVLFSETLSLPNGLKANEIIRVTEPVMQKVSGMQHPEGILAEFPMPPPSSLSAKKRILALDGVNDPGNVGNLIRTALALGWDGVFILNEGCDPFNEKAVRAARGATFRLPLSWGNLKDLSALIKMNQLHPLVANLTGTSVGNVKFKEKILLVMGNEAHGPSEEIKAICEKVTIPMPGEMESLNVTTAAGILMYILTQSEV